MRWHSELREHEDNYRRGFDADTVPAIAGAIRGRYDLTEDGDDVPSIRAKAA